MNPKSSYPNICYVTDFFYFTSDQKTPRGRKGVGEENERHSGWNEAARSGDRETQTGRDEHSSKWPRLCTFLREMYKGRNGTCLLNIVLISSIRYSRN